MIAPISQYDFWKTMNNYGGNNYSEDEECIAIGDSIYSCEKCGAPLTNDGECLLNQTH